jgi:hypothetical protein
MQSRIIENDVNINFKTHFCIGHCLSSIASQFEVFVPILSSKSEAYNRFDLAHSEQMMVTELI